MIRNVFSQEDLSYLLNHETTIQAKNSGNVVAYFTVPATDSIVSALKEQFHAPINEPFDVPLRWIMGDTPLASPNVEPPSGDGEKTILVYLTDSVGCVTIGEEAHPISANTGFEFLKGTAHYTTCTKGSRLLLGPMNDRGEPIPYWHRLLPELCRCPETNLQQYCVQ